MTSNNIEIVKGDESTDDEIYKAMVAACNTQAKAKSIDYIHVIFFDVPLGEVRKLRPSARSINQVIV